MSPLLREVSTEPDVAITQSHVCVYQTALDLLANGFRVHAVADAVSSCNPEEMPIALSGMRQAGVNVTTSECLAFRLMGTCYKWALYQPSVTMGIYR